MAKYIDADKIPYKKNIESLGNGMYRETETIDKSGIECLEEEQVIPESFIRDFFNGIDLTYVTPTAKGLIGAYKKEKVKVKATRKAYLIVDIPGPDFMDLDLHTADVEYSIILPYSGQEFTGRGVLAKSLAKIIKDQEIGTDDDILKTWENGCKYGWDACEGYINLKPSEGKEE